MEKKGISEELNVAILGVLALAFVGVFIYAFWITDGEPITGQVIRDGTAICPSDYSPVCGVDGNTYSNSCLMEVEGIEMSYLGECISAGIIYFNGSIIIEEGILFSNVDAIGLKGGNVVFLGNQIEVMLFQGEATVMSDLMGGGLMINFIEGSFSKVESVKIISRDAIGELRGELNEQEFVEIRSNLGERPIERDIVGY